MSDRDLIPAMIVDDEKLTIEDLSTIVSWEECGYRIVAKTFNGKQGIRKYNEFHPRLILTDIKMPFMDGIQMSEEIRKTDPDVMIVLLTAYEEFEYAKAAIRIGVTDYLIKSEITPLSFREFLKKTRKQILRRDREKRAIESISPDRIAAGAQHLSADEEPAGRSSAADQDGSSLNAPQGEYSRPVREALSYIQQHYRDPDLSLNDVAEYVKLSAGYFGENFKKETGITVKNYITSVRIEAAKRMMDSGNYRIYEISRAVGYRSAQYFSQAFQKKTGIFPKDYRKGEDAEKN